MKYLTLTLLLLSISYSTIAQSLMFPKELVYYEAKAETEEEQDGHYTVTKTFHPIGWSQDGKFAYAEFFDSYADGLTILVSIQDMKTDKLIWQEETIDGSNEKELWNSIRSKTEKALLKHEIKFNQKIDYRKESWHRINGQAYKFALTANNRIQIDCRAKGLGEKTIFKQKITPEDFEYEHRGASVSGIIKSPYEDRVIVVYQKLSKGFEFMNDETFHLVGCHLTKGFE